MESAAAEVKHMCAQCQAVSPGLKQCNGCHIIRYCGVACQKKHWPSHRERCKSAAEARDDGTPHRKANERIAVSIVKAFSARVRARFGPALLLTGAVLLVTYTGPPNPTFDIEKALSGEAPSEHLQTKMVSLEAALAFLHDNNLPPSNGDNRAAWRSSPGRVIVASGADGKAFTRACCVSLRFPGSV